MTHSRRKPDRAPGAKPLTPQLGITTGIPWWERPYLSVDDAAEVLACSRAQVYRLASAGSLSLVRNVGRTLVTRQSILEQISQAQPFKPSGTDPRGAARRSFGRGSAALHHRRKQYMRPPIDFDAVLRRMEARTGLFSGFTTDRDRARFPYSVTLEGLAPEKIGYCKFRDTLHDCICAAVELAPLNFRHNAYYEHHQRIGYHFIFACWTTAIKFAFHCKIADLAISVRITGPRLLTSDKAPATSQDMP